MPANSSIPELPASPPVPDEFPPVPVAALPQGKPLDRGIFHVTGELLVPHGRPLTPEVFQAFSSAGILHVYLVPKGREARFRVTCNTVVMGMEVYNLLKDGILATDLYGPEGDRLFVKGEVWSQRVREDLRSQGIAQLRMPREHAPEALARVEAFRQWRPGQLPPPRKPVLDLPADRLQQDPKRNCTESALDFQIVQGTFVKDSLSDAPSGPMLKECLVPNEERGPRSEAEKSICSVGEQDLHAATARLFDAARKNRQIDGRDVGALANRIIEMMLRDRELLLSALGRVTLELSPDLSALEDLYYLPHHAVRVSVLAINVATTMGYSDRQVYELGHGALLADIGMVRVPREILSKSGNLTHGEITELHRHPIHSINMLQNFRIIPYSSPLIAYQSHERPDRSGYPKGRPDKLLHRFSKIVSLSDIYCATTADRHYRPARLPYKAIEELLRINLEHKVSRDCLEALLRCINLYPIGSWVRLSSGEVGKVVAANESRYDRPCIRVHYEGNSKIPSRLVNLSEHADDALKVVEAIPSPPGMEDPLAGI